LVPVFKDLVERHLPDWEAFNIVDESLLKNTIHSGALSAMTMRRLADYVWSAADAGADAILVTCSSVGAAVDMARPMCPVPLMRVDLGMVEKALDTGTRVGVLATLSTTLEPTAELIRARAALRDTDITVVNHLCKDAFTLLSAGDQAAHDAEVVAGLLALAKEVDVVVLAQASMARALTPEIQSELKAPVYSSPELGVLALKDLLEDSENSR
jgi:Asp/Glu/hydantoin racemase